MDDSVPPHYCLFPRKQWVGCLNRKRRPKGRGLADCLECGLHVPVCSLRADLSDHMPAFAVLFAQISQQHIVQVYVLTTNCIKLYRGIKNKDKLNQQTISNKNTIISSKEVTTAANTET